MLAGRRGAAAELVEDGYLLGLVTGNVEAAAHIKLHRARLNRFFSFGGYGSDSTDRGELTRIALERAALVYGEDRSRRSKRSSSATPRTTSRARMPPGSSASASAATTSRRSSCARRAPTTRSPRLQEGLPL